MFQIKRTKSAENKDNGFDSGGGGGGKKEEKKTAEKTQYTKQYKHKGVKSHPCGVSKRHVAAMNTKHAQDEVRVGLSNTCTLPYATLFSLVGGGLDCFEYHCNFLSHE